VSARRRDHAAVLGTGDRLVREMKNLHAGRPWCMSSSAWV
jgi:hypothetical protein